MKMFRGCVGTLHKSHGMSKTGMMVFFVVTILAALVSVTSAFPHEQVDDYDLVDFDSKPFFDMKTRKLHLNTSRHQVQLQLQEHKLPGVPVFSLQYEGQMLPYQFSKDEKALLFKDADGKSSLLAFEDDNGQTHIRGFVVDDDGHILVEPAHASVRSKREAGNWHMVYRREASEGESYLDAVLPTGSALAEWRAALGKPLPLTVRAGSVDKWVEVLAFTDYDLYDAFRSRMGLNDQEKVVRSIKLFMSLLMSTVDDMYKASFRNEADMRINVRLVGLIVSTVPGKSPWTESPEVQLPFKPFDSVGRKTSEVYAGLDVFLKWLSTYSPPVSYDLPMFVTGRNLARPDGDDKTQGVGLIAGVCDKVRGAAAIESTASFEEARVIAHEIAHTLGSEHDGEQSSPDAARCVQTDGFVMASGNQRTNLQNKYFFSWCSKLQMKKTLSMTSKQCVNNLAFHDAYTADISSKYLAGQLYSYSDLCKARYGQKAASVSYEMLTGANLDVCSGLHCAINMPNWSAQYLFGVSVPPATPCGDGKWCSEGVCAFDPRAPRGDCYLGDTVYEFIDFSVGASFAYQCPDAVTFLMKRFGYTSTADACNRDAKFKKNCCRSCGASGGINTALRDSLLSNNANPVISTSAPKPTTKPVQQVLPTTTSPPRPSTIPCADHPRIAPYCMTYVSLCFMNYTIRLNGVAMGTVEDLCYATCGRCRTQ